MSWQSNQMAELDSTESVAPMILLRAGTQFQIHPDLSLDMSDVVVSDDIIKYVYINMYPQKFILRDRV